MFVSEISSTPIQWRWMDFSLLCSQHWKKKAVNTTLTYYLCIYLMSYSRLPNITVIFNLLLGMFWFPLTSSAYCSWNQYRWAVRVNQNRKVESRDVTVRKLEFSHRLINLWQHRCYRLHRAFYKKRWSSIYVERLLWSLLSDGCVSGLSGPA